MKNELLLIEDVDDLGRSGDLVSVKPGYGRNYLLPQKKAVVADKRSLRMRARLQEERAKRAIVDKKEAEELAKKIMGIELSTIVKVDPEGHMYGSVAATDIVDLFAQQGHHIEKRNVVLAHPIKTLGVHQLALKLKEGVPVTYSLTVISDIPLPERKKAEMPAAAPTQEEETSS